MKQKPLLIVLGMLVLLPPVAFAQTPGGLGSRAARRERARTFLVLRIVDALGLNDEDALKVSRVIRHSDVRRQGLIKQRHLLEDELRAALGHQPPDTAHLGKLVSEGNAIDRKLALIPEDTFHELQKTLSVAQQARLLLLRRELQGEIRRAMRARHGGAPRWSGGAGAEGHPSRED
ncbi:MAG: hypothetical protein ACE5I7_09085 [Candidatus Binatia bacterium]